MLCLLSAGCHRAGVHGSLQKNLNAPSSPKILAVYEPWFGDPDHINIGYSSQDKAVLKNQVQKAKDLTIAAFVVDWYGKRKPFLDGAFAALQQVAAGNDFKVILMYDEPADAEGHSTEFALTSLEYAYQRYIGPEAQFRSSYFTHEGRPVIFVWPRNKTTDWKRIRSYVNTWENPPVLIMEDGDPRNAEYFDGFYAWVQPGERGWQRDGSNRGLEYLEGFYRRMREEHPRKMAVGAAWPGFDDSRASWGQSRFMDAKCGQTFDDTLRMFRRFYDTKNPSPFLLVITWNDYEEGTAIERGIGRCNSGPAKGYVSRE